MIQCLSAVLAGKPEQVNWSAFTRQDWQQFLQTAHQHRVSPLLWYTLQAGGWPDAVPTQVRNALHMAFYQTTAQNTLLYQELARILKALQGIPVVVLKGAALANTLYPTIGTRPMGDIDLLVPRQHLLHIVRMLRPLGYRLCALNHDLVLYNAQRQVPWIELHWSLIYGDTKGVTPPIAWFWEQTESWVLQPPAPGDQVASGQRARQLRPTANLLYLNAHLMLQHGAEPARLLWIYDLYRVSIDHADQLDRDEMLQRAEAFGWRTALDAGLSTMHGYLGSSVSGTVSSILSDLQTRHSSSSDQYVCGLGRPSQRLASVYDVWSSLDWVQRLYLLPLVLFPAFVYLKTRYDRLPGWFWPLLYVYRWLDIAGAALHAAAKTTRKSVIVHQEDH